MNNTLDLLVAEINKEILDSKNNPSFAVFDFDNSCIVNDIAEAMLAYMCRNKLLKDITLLSNEKYDTQKYHENIFGYYYKLLGQGEIKKAYLFCAEVISGFNKSEIETIVQETIKTEGEELGQRELFNLTIASGLAVWPQIKKLAETLRDLDIEIFIVTASPEITVEIAARHYDFPGKVIGLKNKIEGEIFTKEIEEPYSILEGKVACIKKYIGQNKKPVLAVGDNMNDLFMLEYAKIKLVIDRQNDLARIARVRGWYTM